ncbi:hypothetical protein VTK73DRAFT_5038 [Phialemonium thermophilum]|uniref:Uncharacterized protein n=1 Tax=Phialemonium thermophilum TaxID=223376 RepID=A0ABR3V459_9PEZI
MCVGTDYNQRAQGEPWTPYIHWSESERCRARGRSGSVGVGVGVGGETGRDCPGGKVKRPCMLVTATGGRMHDQGRVRLPRAQTRNRQSRQGGSLAQNKEIKKTPWTDAKKQASRSLARKSSIHKKRGMTAHTHTKKRQANKGADVRSHLETEEDHQQQTQLFKGKV